jgi:hypothetical protein
MPESVVWGKSRQVRDLRSIRNDTAKKGMNELTIREEQHSYILPLSFYRIHDLEHELVMSRISGKYVSSSCNSLESASTIQPTKHIPWKFMITFAAFELPTQCALVPSCKTTLFGVKFRFLHAVT